jgi:AcrR family transcriptional regulator
MNIAALQARKQPQQARATAMVGVILEAATRVLARESLAGFNTNRVAAVAGVSVGSLYQYYPNKQALIAALIQRDQDALCAAVEHSVQASTGKSLQQALAALVSLAVQHQFGNAVYAAALDHEEKRLPLQAELAASRQRIVRAVKRLLKEHRATLAPGLCSSAAQDCLTMTQALVEAQSGGSAQQLAQLKRRVLRALLGYLQHQPV